MAALLKKHPVAVSRWVSDAARQRREEPVFGHMMDELDEALSAWALEACRRGEFATDFDGSHE